MEDTKQESDWWWMGFTEGGADPALDEDLELLLRQWLKEADPVADWPIENRLERLRANVMAAIEEESSGGPQRADTDVATKSLRV